MAEEIDPALIDRLNKLGIVLDTVSSSMDANNKTLKSAAATAAAEEQARKKLIDVFSRSGSIDRQSQEQSKKRIKTEQELLTTQEERLKSDQAEEYYKKANRARQRAAVGSLINELKTFASSSISATQSMYGTDQAYSAVVPVLNTMASAAKTAVSAITSLFSSVPILGGISDAVGKVAGAAIDLTVQYATAQLENTQKFVNTYQQLSKVGVTFGGAIEMMRKSAAEGGMNIQQYTKFVTGSIESLSALGGSVETGASRVAKFGSELVKTNPKLEAMYGSIDAVQSATADYIAMQARYGIDTTKNTKDLAEGAKNYLYNMKELSNLTGKSADALKKSEEERQKSAAYQIELSRMGRDQQENTRKSIEITASTFGTVAEKYAQEFIATNGRVTSEQALQFKAFFPEIAKTVELSLNATKSTQADFTRANAEIIESRKDINNKEVMAKEGQLKLQAGAVAGNPIFEMLNSVSAATIKTFEKQGDAMKTAAKLEEERNAAMTTGTEKFVAAIDALTKFQMTIDATTEQHLGRTGTLVTGLIKVQTKIEEIFGPRFDTAIELSIKGIEKLGESLQKLDELLNGTPEEPANTANLPTPENAMNPGADFSSIADAGNTGGPTRTLYQGAHGGLLGGIRDILVRLGGGTGVEPILPPGLLSNGKIGTGLIDKSLQDKLAMIASAYPGSTITALNDADSFKIPKPDGTFDYPHAPPDVHGKGQAVDFVPKDYDPKNAAQYVKSLKEMGFSMAQAETAGQGNATGPHIHAALKDGGLTNGPSLAGEAGPEAVVPLPDGRTIPVSMDHNPLIAKFDEMISILKDHRDISEKTMWAAA